MVEFYSFSQDNAQNWANFKHYAEQNKLLKATVIVPKRVVFIGNSITEGWVNQHPDFFKQNGYVSQRHFHSMTQVTKTNLSLNYTRCYHSRPIMK